MAGEAEAAKAAADAASTVIRAEPVMGSLLILALVAILGLLWWIKSIFASWGQERQQWHQQHLDTQEKRIAEGRVSLSSQADVQAILTRQTETWRDMERSMEGIGSLLREFSTEERMATASNREMVGRIEGAMKDVLGKLDKLHRRIEQPLVQTSSGLRRPTGDDP